MQCFIVLNVNNTKWLYCLEESITTQINTSIFNPIILCFKGKFFYLMPQWALMVGIGRKICILWICCTYYYKLTRVLYGYTIMNMAKLLHWSLGIHYNQVLLFIYTCVYTCICYFVELTVYFLLILIYVP